MSEPRRLLGIVIAMHCSDHDPPHLHAEYGNHEIRMAIEGDAIPFGSLMAPALPRFEVALEGQLWGEFFRKPAAQL